MISLQTLAAAPLPAWRTPLQDQRKPASAQDAAPDAGLPSLAEMQDSQKAMKKELAAKKVQAVRERRDALMLMVKIDPKAALKMTVEMAKELKEAVEDYVDAGGKNVTDGEMAMMRRDANEARDAADEALENLPPETAAAAQDEETEAAETADPRIEAELKKAQAAYAAAFSVADTRDETADRAEAIFGAAMNDQGFFMQVKLAMGELKDARDKIKADWAHLRAPSKEDWKVDDKAMGELEKAMDMAPTGAPEISDAPRAMTA